VSKVRNQVP